jgi:TrmH family RNA methyltransferase
MIKHSSARQPPPPEPACVILVSTLTGPPTGTLKRITSPANPLIKDIRRAIARNALTDDGLCVVEGFNLLLEASRSGCEITHLLGSETGMYSPNSTVIPDELFATISTTQASQGVIALVRPPRWTLNQLFTAQSLVVILDAVQDPGNAGAIVRAAEAFGATGVFFGKGTVSPWNPKTLRASAGSLFRVPFVTGLPLPRSLALNMYAAMPTAPGRRSAIESDLISPCALIIGNEGQGISDDLQSLAEPITIPTTGVESLNAAVAAAVLLYEARRQRMQS